MSASLSEPAPRYTLPRLAKLLAAAFSVTLPSTVYNDSVPAVIAAEADCVMAAAVPVVRNVAPPLAVTLPVNVIAALLERLSAPDPKDNSPKLVMVFDADPSVTLPFSVVNDNVPAVMPTEVDWAIGTFVPVVVI